MLAAAMEHHRAGRLAEAEQGYGAILARFPDHAATLRYAAQLARQRGDTSRAAALLERFIAQNPNEVTARVELADLLASQGRWDRAAEQCVEVLRINPASAETYIDLGNNLLAQERSADAAAAYRRAVELNPSLIEAHNNLGYVCASAGQHDAAVEHYNHALRLHPDHPGVLFNLANLLAATSRTAEAVAAYRRILQLQPNAFQVHNNLANALKNIGEIDTAIQHARRAIELQPDSSEIQVNCAGMLRTVGRHEEAGDFELRAVELKPASSAVWGAYLFGMLRDPGAAPEAIRAAHERYNERFAVPLASRLSRRAGGGRLRIGYVSPDFKDHVVGRNILPLLRHHDKSRFEIFCYSNVAKPDACTNDFRALADHWCDITCLSDESAAAQVRQDGIDILVDLALHTDGNRLLLFARKPAPVQVTFAGYPGTTGLAAIDCRLTDPYLDPPGMNDAWYSEKSVRLPATFWCYEPPHADLTVGPLPLNRNGCITFGCLNVSSKVNDEVLALWSRVLVTAGPTARLMLLSERSDRRRQIADIMLRAGVAPERIDFVERLPSREYMELYHRIDIALDTLPYNGHTTTLDGLWMGVPVVTLVGGTTVGRAGFSQLSNLALSDLVAKSPEDFVRIACGLALDVPRLRSLRASLRSMMQDSPLMNAPQFARDIEAAYQSIYARLA